MGSSILDMEGNLVWETQAVAAEFGFNSVCNCPWVELASWPWHDLGYPPGSYEVVLETSIGEFTKKFIIEDRGQ